MNTAVAATVAARLLSPPPPADLDTLLRAFIEAAPTERTAAARYSRGAKQAAVAYAAAADALGQTLGDTLTALGLRRSTLRAWQTTAARASIPGVYLGEIHRPAGGAQPPLTPLPLERVLVAAGAIHAAVAPLTELERRMALEIVTSWHALAPPPPPASQAVGEAGSASTRADNVEGAATAASPAAPSIPSASPPQAAALDADARELGSSREAPAIARAQQLTQFWAGPGAMVAPGWFEGIAATDDGRAVKPPCRGRCLESDGAACGFATKCGDLILGA